MPHPFFIGIIEGATGRPPQLYYGARRTAANLGLMGESAYSAVSFHNEISARATRYGLRYLIGRHPTPVELAEVWGVLPEEARGDIANFAWNRGGQIVGGGLISAATSRVLVSGFGAPRRVVLPAMFILSAQGAMAAIWKDA